MLTKNKILTKAFELAVKPVLSEIPFFVVSFILLIPRTLFYVLKEPQKLLVNMDQYPTFRFLSLALMFSYSLTVCVYAVKNKMLKIVFYFILYLLFFVNLYLAVCFKASLSPNTMLMLLETNGAEVMDFITTFVFTWRSYFVILVVAALIAFNLFFERRFDSSLLLSLNIGSKRGLCIVIIIMISCGIYSMRLYPQLIKCKTAEDLQFWNPDGKSSMDNITNTVYSFYYLHLMNDFMEKAVASTTAIRRSNQSCLNPQDTCNVILIIGESFIKSHSSLYGYYLKTNPKLLKEASSGNLLVFNDVITPSVSTSTAVRNMLSCNSIGDGEQWYDYPFFPTIFKKAGYNVWFWDNQYKPVSNADFDFSLNSYLHNKVIEKDTYDASQQYVSMYDGELVNDFFCYYNSHGKGVKNLYIFHLQGQHFNPLERYPDNPDFSRFTAKDIHRNEPWLNESKKNIIAHYDNCTYYNDHVVGSIVDFFRDSSTVMIYLSDHADSIYDIEDFRGRKFDLTSEEPQLIRQYYSVPFFIWFSNRYIHEHPQIINTAKNAINKPFMTDNICHLMLKVGGVISDKYLEKRDVLSDLYVCPPRLVNDSIDYDRLK